MAEFKINNTNHRENVVVALSHAGYTVTVEERRTTGTLYNCDYYVVVNERSLSDAND